MNKNVVISVILVVVIVVGLFFVGKALGLFGSSVEIPDAVKNTPEERIDNETFAVMTKTMGEWAKLGEKDGAYLNPETKKYTMVLPMTCGSCGQMIPRLNMPAELKREPKDAAELLEIETEKTRLKTEHICPKCQKPAYSGMGAGFNPMGR